MTILNRLPKFVPVAVIAMLGSMLCCGLLNLMTDPTEWQSVWTAVFGALILTVLNFGNVNQMIDAAKFHVHFQPGMNEPVSDDKAKEHVNNVIKDALKRRHAALNRGESWWATYIACLVTIWICIAGFEILDLIPGVAIDQRDAFNISGFCGFTVGIITGLTLWFQNLGLWMQISTMDNEDIAGYVGELQQSYEYVHKNVLRAFFLPIFFVLWLLKCLFGSNGDAGVKQPAVS